MTAYRVPPHAMGSLKLTVDDLIALAFGAHNLCEIALNTPINPEVVRDFGFSAAEWEKLGMTDTIALSLGVPDLCRSTLPSWIPTEDGV